MPVRYDDPFPSIYKPINVSPSQFDILTSGTLGIIAVDILKRIPKLLERKVFAVLIVASLSRLPRVHGAKNPCIKHLIIFQLQMRYPKWSPESHIDG